MKTLICALLALLPALASAQTEEPFGPAEVVNGVRVFRASGSPAEIGAAVGENFREEILWLYEKYFETYTDDPKFRTAFIRAAYRLEKHLTDGERDELEALARACGLTYEQCLVVHTFLDSVREVNCSTFVLQPPATEEGGLIFGRNLDFPGRGVAHTHTIVLVVRPEGGHAYAAVTWPGMNGVLSGMNEHGLALAVMNVYNKEEALKGVPYIMLFRRILAGCRTFDEAVAVMKASPRTCGNNLMVVDADGKAGVIEFDHAKCEIREPKEGAIIATNHHRLGPKNQSFACPRWFRLTQLEQTWHGRIGLDEAKKLLQAVPQGEMTLQSMIFLPKERRLYLAAGKLPATKGKFREVDGLFGAESGSK